jgi:hypothetical protein
MASLTIRPGSRIRLKGQAAHTPDFFVVRCDRDRCWVRQYGWNPEAELNVRFTQIYIPDAEDASMDSDDNAPVLDNVVYMDDFRQRRVR